MAKDIDLSETGAVCDDCASLLGYTRKDKAVGVWTDECGVCHQRKPCTDLHHDWKPIKSHRADCRDQRLDTVQEVKMKTSPCYADLDEFWVIGDFVAQAFMG